MTAPTFLKDDTADLWAWVRGRPVELRWTPSHRSVLEVTPAEVFDRLANAEADSLAKQAALGQLVPDHLRVWPGGVLIAEVVRSHTLLARVECAASRRQSGGLPLVPAAARAIKRSRADEPAARPLQVRARTREPSPPDAHPAVHVFAAHPLQGACPAPRPRPHPVGSPRASRCGCQGHGLTAVARPSSLRAVSKTLEQTPGAARRAAGAGRPCVHPLRARGPPGPLEGGRPRPVPGT